MAAFSRLKRLGEIGAVAVKYGLTPFIPRTLLTVLKLENRNVEEKSFKDMKVEERFRLAFEELGTTFIKMGQILSLRGDIIPHSMAEEFEKLTDDVNPIDFSLIKPIIEEEFATPLEKIFDNFNETPIAAASISQVYEAILKETGETVVIKVRKPGLVETIKSDMEIIIWIADILQKTSSYSKSINFKGIAEEFFWTINQELDLIIEKSNTQKLALNFQEEQWSWLHFPKMHEKYCTNKVLVMEKIEGVKLHHVIESDNLAEFNRKTIAERGARALMKMVLVDGFFHADLHSGNIFFKPDNEIVAIDCGMCCKIDRYLREKIADMFIAFIARDFEKVARIYIEISESDTPINRKDFENDIRKIFDSLPESISELNTAEIITKSFKVMFKHKLQVPRELTLLIKSLSMIEGISRELDPEFKMIAVAEKLLKELLAERYSPDKIAGDIFSLLIKMVDLLKNFPGVISNIAEKIEDGTIQHRFLVLFGKSERHFISKMVTRISSALTITGAMMAASLVENKFYLHVIYVVFGLSALAFISTFFKGKDRNG
ncbi:MAG: ABC1 kinase family protein [bacterium]